jgi:ankyrin repeat protein
MWKFNMLLLYAICICVTVFGSENKGIYSCCCRNKPQDKILIRNDDNELKIWQQKWKDNLLKAVKEQDIEFLKKSEEIKINNSMRYLLDAQKETKSNILHIALKKKNVEVVKILIKIIENMDPETLIELLMQENKQKQTSLHLAAMYNQQAIITLILEKVEKIDDPH